MKISYNKNLRVPGTLIVTILLLFSIEKTNAAITWLGTTSSSWTNSANWTPAQVPTSSDDVIIPSLVGATYPVLDGTGLAAKTLAIATGATLFGKPGKDLTVHGFVDLDGTFITGNSPVTIMDSLYGAGTLDGGSSVIHLAGNMSVTAFTDSISIVILNGSALQEIHGYTFYDLYVDNSSTGIKLMGGPTVTDTLKMMSGNVALNGKTFTLGASTSNIGVLVWTSGFFTGTSGSFRRWFNTSAVSMGTDAGLFPMGTTTSNNRSLWISGTAGTGGTISVLHIDSNGRAFISPKYLDNSGNLRVNVRWGAKWVVSTANSFAGSSEDMRIQGSAIPGINNVDSLTMSLWNSIAPGTYTVPTGTAANPLVRRNTLSATNLNNTFYIASDTPLNPLPVDLVYFNALYQDGHVNLNWQTASEINSSYFAIDRSADGLTWKEIGRVDAHGNSSVINNYASVDNLSGVVPAGTIYYRLKQVDFNGLYNNSEVRSVYVSNQMPQVFQAWPNPAADYINLTWENKNASASWFTISDLNGSELYRETEAGTGTFNKKIDLNLLKPGFYYLQVVSGNEIQTRLICKK
jgi:hypothetical protein